MVSPIELRKALEVTMKDLNTKKRISCLPIIHTVSSLSGYGMDVFKLLIADILTQNWNTNGTSAPSTSDENDNVK